MKPYIKINNKCITKWFKFKSKYSLSGMLIIRSAIIFLQNYKPLYKTSYFTNYYSYNFINFYYFECQYTNLISYF